MAKLKAILVTEENVERLRSQYNETDDENSIVVGYYVVSEFGVYDHYFTIEKDRIGYDYELVKRLQNGYVEVKKI